MEHYIDEWHRERDRGVVAAVGSNPRIPDDTHYEELGSEGEEIPAETMGSEGVTTESRRARSKGAETKDVKPSDVETKVVEAQDSGQPQKMQADTK